MVLVLVGTPLMGFGPVKALADEGTPAAVESPVDQPTDTPVDQATDTPVDQATDTPVESATPADPIPSETPTDPAATSETSDGEAADLGTPVADASPSASPSETATATVTATSTPVVGNLADLSITISCNTSPETVRVLNTGVGYIELQSIGSIVDLIGGEPFALSRTLRPGKTAIFQSGDGAQYGTVLTPRFIYTNSAYDAEGVKVGTDVGVATKMCAPKPPPPPGKLSDLTITLSCTSTAENIRVTNNGTDYINVKGIATYIDPIADEPFAVKRLLRPGATANFSSGAGAKYGTILTTEYIFTNAAYEKDGVRVNTDVGKAFKACPVKPVPPEHWIEVNLSLQYLTAWEGNKKVNGTYVSTGKPGFETPTGTFRILYRYWSQTMSGCIQGECYYVPDVPYVQYFTNYGHALHGAYWHNDFGIIRRSHGCVNLPVPFSEWLWYWATYGTRVWIHY
jgi:lipoprotein-anchoring transpeptidase ErfK/SrfK